MLVFVDTGFGLVASVGSEWLDHGFDEVLVVEGRWFLRRYRPVTFRCIGKRCFLERLVVNSPGFRRMVSRKFVIVCGDDDRDSFLIDLFEIFKKH